MYCSYRSKFCTVVRNLSVFEPMCTVVRRKFCTVMQILYCNADKFLVLEPKVHVLQLLVRRKLCTVVEAIYSVQKSTCTVVRSNFCDVEEVIYFMTERTCTVFGHRFCTVVKTITLYQSAHLLQLGRFLYCSEGNILQQSAHVLQVELNYLMQ